MVQLQDFQSLLRRDLRKQIPAVRKVQLFIPRCQKQANQTLLSDLCARKNTSGADIFHLKRHSVEFLSRVREAESRLPAGECKKLCREYTHTHTHLQGSHTHITCISASRRMCGSQVYFRAEKSVIPQVRKQEQKIDPTRSAQISERV